MEKNKLDVAVFSHTTSIHVKNRYRFLQDLGHNSQIIWPKAPAKSLWRLLPGIIKAKADIYHCHYAYSKVTMFAFLTGKFPLLISTMGGDVLLEEQWDASLIDKKITRLLLKHADGVTAKSDYNRKVIAALGRPERDTMVLNWGVETSLFRTIYPTPTFGKISPDQKVILHPRGLEPIYNVPLMLEALRKVINDGQEVKLLLPKASGSPHIKAIWQKIEALSLTQYVIGAADYSPQEMNTLYNRANLVISIAKSDGIPMTVLEALATGTPVILGKLPHLQQEFDDRVVEWTELDADSIATTIKFALENDSCDAAMQRREFVEKHYNSARELEKYNAELYRLACIKPAKKWLPRCTLLGLMLVSSLLKIATALLGRQTMKWAYLRPDYPDK